MFDRRQAAAQSQAGGDGHGLEKVLRLYREQYFDFNVKHFAEKLAEEHAIQLSYSWIKTALQTAGLVARQRKRGRPP